MRARKIKTPLVAVTEWDVGVIMACLSRTRRDGGDAGGDAARIFTMLANTETVYLKPSRTRQGDK